MVQDFFNEQHIKLLECFTFIGSQLIRSSLLPQISSFNSQNWIRRTFSSILVIFVKKYSRSQNTLSNSKTEIKVSQIALIQKLFLNLSKLNLGCYIKHCILPWTWPSMWLNFKMNLRFKKWRTTFVQEMFTYMKKVVLIFYSQLENNINWDFCIK